MSLSACSPLRPCMRLYNVPCSLDAKVPTLFIHSTPHINPIFTKKQSRASPNTVLKPSQNTPTATQCRTDQRKADIINHL